MYVKKTDIRKEAPKFDVIYLGSVCGRLNLQTGASVGVTVLLQMSNTRHSCNRMELVIDIDRDFTDTQK
jgi:hypothetical protein